MREIVQRKQQPEGVATYLNRDDFQCRFQSCSPCLAGSNSTQPFASSVCFTIGCTVSPNLNTMLLHVQGLSKQAKRCQTKQNKTKQNKKEEGRRKENRRREGLLALLPVLLGHTLVAVHLGCQCIGYFLTLKPCVCVCMCDVCVMCVVSV